jgi:GH25 family lysozyme M1 (1,4-beta-N-acetylmuramidase)
LPDAVRRPAHRPISVITLVIGAVIAALLATTLASVVAPADVLGATSTKTVLCTANARKSAPSTSSAIATTLKPGTKVTVTATLTGSSWSVSCGGKTTASNTWYRISAINGQSVKSLFNVTYLFAATGLISTENTTAATGSTKVVTCIANAHVTGPSVSTKVIAKLKPGTQVTVTATLKGSTYGATCQGKTSKTNTWYRVSAIGGKSVKSLYHVTYVFVATAWFTAAPPPTPSGLTEGIDISHWQGTIDWVKVAAAGKRFAFMKASEDIDFVDTTYPANRAAANANGIIIGAYHFAQPDTSPGDAQAEADHFLDTAHIASGDLPPVLDLEVSGGLTVPQLQDWVRGYLGRIYERTGVRGVIYMSPAFWVKYAGDTTWFADNGYKVLWIAHWTTASAPTLPADAWGGNGWTFWQYTSSGSVSGISGRVDLDRFNGTDFTRVRIP